MNLRRMTQRKIEIPATLDRAPGLWLRFEAFKAEVQAGGRGGTGVGPVEVQGRSFRRALGRLDTQRHGGVASPDAVGVGGTARVVGHVRHGDDGGRAGRCDRLADAERDDRLGSVLGSRDARCLLGRAGAHAHPDAEHHEHDRGRVRQRPLTKGPPPSASYGGIAFTVAIGFAHTHE